VGRRFDKGRDWIVTPSDAHCTTVWIDFLTGIQNASTELLDHEMDRQRLGLTDLILCEVLQTVRGDALFLETERLISRFEVHSTGGAELATASARNYRTLRTRGVTVRTTIDCLIASFCILNGHSPLHRDRDFDAFEKYLGLRVVNPELF
jgi:predicted nucleic acid-binding protein